MNLPREMWQLPLLRGIDARGRSDLVLASVHRRYPKGSRILAQGDIADSLFILCNGEIEMVRRGGEAEFRHAVSAFGEEALLGVSMRRRFSVSARDECILVSLPASVIERAIVRQGGDDWFERERRLLRRAHALRVFEQNGETLNRAGAWVDSAFDVEMKAGQNVHVPSGTRLVVVSGILEEIGTRDGRVGFRAGDHVAPRVDSRSLRALAPTWILADRPLSPRNGPPLEPHEIDLARWETATSLLLTNLDRCVSCNECEAACREAHADGIARFQRAGQLVRATIDGRSAPWAVGASCHHCETPACLPVCPTGAIRRNSSGVVTIEESLCTACGSCERACEWGNIWIAPPVASLPARAVKCDACAESGGEPSCVAACPTGALIRTRPVLSAAEMGASPRARSYGDLFEWFALVVPLVCAWIPFGKAASGALAAAIHLLLVGYAARRRRIKSGKATYVAHLSLGLAALVLVLKHGAPSAASHLPFALWITFWTAALFGIAGAILYRVVPPRLTTLHVEGNGQTGEIDAARFRALSGHSNAVKNVYLARIRPFERSTLGTARCAVDPVGVERTLHASISRLASLKPEERASLERLVRLAVDEKKSATARWMTAGMRSVIAIHAIAAIVLLPLMVLHGVLACFGR